MDSIKLPNLLISRSLLYNLYTKSSKQLIHQEILEILLLRNLQRINLPQLSKSQIRFS
jgi:hypothetical protein